VLFRRFQLSFTCRARPEQSGPCCFWAALGLSNVAEVLGWRQVQRSHGEPRRGKGERSNAKGQTPKDEIETKTSRHWFRFQRTVKCPRAINQLLRDNDRFGCKV
jgi:hypothetical protein